MGRRPDPPGLQEAKGHPSKRKATARARMTEARRVAKLLAAAPKEGEGVLAPPAFLDKRFPAALAAWRMYAPIMARTHRLAEQHRPMFAAFCLYYAEWVWANEDIAINGSSQVVPTVSGDPYERPRFSVKLREIALANCLSLSKQFGMTPADEYALFRDQRVAATHNPGLFDDDQPAAPAEEQAEQATPRSMVGALAGFDSAPPGTRPN